MPLRVPLHQSLYGRVALAYAILLPILLAAQAAAVIVLVNRRDHINRVERPERGRLTAQAAHALSERLIESPGKPVSALLADLEPRDRLFAVMQNGDVAGVRRPDLEEAREFVEGFRRMREFDRVLPAEWSNGDFAVAPITAGPRLLGLVGIVPPTMFEQYGAAIIVLGATLLVLGNLVLGILVVGPIRSRLRDLYQAAGRLRDGELTARATPKGSDELAEVAGAFNEMAAELTSQTNALQTSDRLRRQLVADVAHELMTPLTAVLGRLEALCMSDLQLTAEERNEQANHAMHEARRLERLIGDLLASVRLEAGAVAMTFAPIATEDLFRDLVARHGEECSKRNIVLAAELMADSVVGDAFRLGQALDNLLLNALRYTPDGGRILFKSRDVANGVELAVWDSGGAIGSNHLPHIFERFYKASSAAGIASPGSGLGLSIVKAIVERHGGSTWAASSPSDGTTFTVVLPQAPVTAPTV